MAHKREIRKVLDKSIDCGYDANSVVLTKLKQNEWAALLKSHRPLCWKHQCKAYLAPTKEGLRICKETRLRQNAVLLFFGTAACTDASESVLGVQDWNSAREAIQSMRYIIWGKDFKWGSVRSNDLHLKTLKKLAECFKTMHNCKIADL